MRSRLALALIAAGVCLPAGAQAQGSAGITGPVDAANTLDLRYEPRGLGRLSGTQKLEFTNAASTPLSTVWIRLWANGPDGCKPRRISVRVAAPAMAGRLRSGCTALPVRLAEPLAPGARTAVDLRWTVRGRPNDQYREPWLDETFASYSQQDLVGGFRQCSRRRPYDFLPFFLRRARLDAGMGYYASRSFAYFGLVYDGGACALRSLERDLGPRRMDRLLALLVSRHRQGVATRADVFAAIREVAPAGFDVKRFKRRSRL